MPTEMNGMNKIIGNCSKNESKIPAILDFFLKISKFLLFTTSSLKIILPMVLPCLSTKGVTTNNAINTVKNAAVVQIRADGKWHEGIVYVRNGGKWVEATSVNVRSGGKWYESK